MLVFQHVWRFLCGAIWFASALQFVGGPAKPAVFVFAAIIFITRYRQCALEFISIDRDRFRAFISVIYYSWPLIFRRKAYFIHPCFIFI